MIKQKIRAKGKKINRLILVMPPASGTVAGMPLGLIAIKNYVDLCRWLPVKVLVKDLSRANKNGVNKFINGITKNDLIGITVNTATYQPALNLINYIKGAVACRIIIGGPHVQCESPEVIFTNNKNIDFISIGDGEKTLQKLINKRGIPDEVPGLAYRKDGKIVVNLVENMNKEDMEKVKFRLSNSWFKSPTGKLGNKFQTNRIIPYVSSRGCTKHCPFCAVKEKNIRSISVERIIKDIKYLLSLGYNRINFEDNFFSSSNEKIKYLCNCIIEQNLDFTWDCQTRVELADNPGIVSLMAKAGCREIFLGVENLSEKGLPFIKDLSYQYIENNKFKFKILSPREYIEKTKLIIKLCLGCGIKPTLMLQMGIPNEDEIIKKDNLNELKIIGLIAKEHNKEINIHLMVTVLYPGTPLFRRLKARYNFSDDIFEFWTKWEYKNRNHYIANNFPHGVGGIPISLVDFLALSKKRVVWKKEKFRKIIKYCCAIKSVKGINVINIRDFIIK